MIILTGAGRKGSFNWRRPQAKPISLPGVSLVCGSLLLLLTLFSIVNGPLYDLERRHSLRHYRSRLAFREACEGQDAPDNTSVNSQILSDILPKNLWTSEYAKFYDGCSSPSNFYPRRTSQLEGNGYILIETSGGLNQQRIGITDAVVVARILNATLVVPQLDHMSFWKDNSNFSDIFDLEWFIAALAPDVVIVKELPPKLKLPGGVPYSMRVPRKCTPYYYMNAVLPILHRRKAVSLSKFDYRLSNNLDTELQKLRCRVNYLALRFTKDIVDVGAALVTRLRAKGGRYIALHLRYEADMLAFSGCYFGGGEKERQDLETIRKRWDTLRQHNPDKERRNGKCPLTPKEVGLMLQALGYSSDSHLYIASGEVYGGDNTLSTLKEIFPNLHTKDSLLSKEELQPFLPFSSRMAAIDYVVCDESDVFVTNNNGNMARILAGRRRFFGHKRTIRPNNRKLGKLFMSWPNITWGMFSKRVRSIQKGFIGEPEELRSGKGDFSENPTDCICQKPEMKEQVEALKEQKKRKQRNKKEQGSIQEITVQRNQTEFQTEYKQDKVLGSKMEGERALVK